MYADELVLMAPTLEQLGRHVAEWRASLLDKELTVNAGNTKVMVGSSSGKWPWERSTSNHWSVHSM